LSVPDITITTDVMVGFPGETDHEFDQGFELIRDIGFDGMHVFRYSPRSGTRAAHFSDQVSDGVKTTRSELLRTEAQAGVVRLLDRHQGTVARVAWEGEKDGVWRGLTDTNVRVYGSVPGLHCSELSRARLTAPFADGLWGETPQANIVLTGR
jgi:threonylcarbamoyladenosine tRNA methylthiotransferase MtaB